jgi:AI-2 transport protein TqsA
VDALADSIHRRWPAAPHRLVSFLAGIVAIVAVAGSIFVLAQGVVEAVQQGPALAARLDEFIQAAARSFGISEPLDLKSLVGEVNVRQIAGYLLSGVQGVGGTVILIVIYFGFMLGGQKRISDKFDLIAGAPSGGGLPNTIARRVAADIRTYLWVQAVTGAMITAAAAAVMLAVGLNNVLFWAVIFFLISFIPNIGTTVGSIAPALFALLQFRTAWQAIAIFAVIQLAAFIVGNLIYPRMQAETQNIDPVVVILSLSFWTVLWGLSGAFLAVPMTLILMMVFAQFDSTRWIAAALSNDGKPDFRKRARE